MIRSSGRHNMRHTRLQVLNGIVDGGLVPIFTADKLEVARHVVAACAAAGARVVEFTNRAAHACEVFSGLEKFCSSEYPDLVLGAGSIVEPATAAQFINAGAGFIVAPGLNAEVARLCNRRKVAYIPGCSTATEIGVAEELGCELVKLFPADVLGGPAFVKALMGPCRWTSILAMGGLDCTEESLGPWFEAGVACVGMGTRAIPPDAVAEGSYGTVTANVSKALAAIAAIRNRLERDGRQA